MHLVYNKYKSICFVALIHFNGTLYLQGCAVCGCTVVSSSKMATNVMQSNIKMRVCGFKYVKPISLI